MATKKTTKKAAKKSSKKVTKTAKKTVTKTAKKKVLASKATKRKKPVMQIPFDGKYHYAVGRRKSAIAQVRLYAKDGAKEADYIINGKKMKEYFPTSHEWDFFMEALTLTGTEGKLAVAVLVRGGGLSGQAQAIRLGIARALTQFDDGLRPVLKANGLLTRDARVVERKKPGLRKARRRPQWSKR